jgi:teichuronic acid biosynthesis glycosyltransferase TuaC
MNVLAVTNMYPSPAEPQFGCFVKEQIEDLRGLGVEFEVLFFDGRQKWTNYFIAARTMRRMIEESRFDLIHAHYGLCGAVALTQRHIPVVTTFHGSDFSGAVPWQAQVSRVVARLSTPIFVSEEGASRLRPGAAVVPAGVDTNLFRPIGREKARRKLGWAAALRYVLFPSSPRIKSKRADLFQAVVRQAAADVPSLEPVYLEGYSREQVALVLNAVDVTLVTSDWEGSPVTVRESLACQTPVVSVPVGDLPGVLADLPGCAVLPRDPAALAHAVLEALDVGRASELRARAELYSRQGTAARVMKIYQSAVHE